MFNKAYLEPPAHLAFALSDAHAFTPAEVAELHDHFRSQAAAQWGCTGSALWGRVWPLSAVGTIPSIARFPSVLMDPSLHFAAGDEPSVSSYHEAVQGAYKRIRDTYRQIPEMACPLCFVAPAASWWPYSELYPVVITADNPATLLHAVYLSVGLANEEARGMYPRARVPKGRVGRAADPERAGRYAQWLEECAVYRARVDELKAEYDAAFQESERARKAWREFQSQGAPIWNP